MAKKIKMREEIEDIDDLEEDFEEDFEEEKKPKTNNFAYWEVGGNSYRLKLKTRQIEELESKYRTNLMNLMGSETGMPALKVMLDIAHCAMKEWHHNIKYQHVVKLFDKYIDEGGSQLKFYTDVFMNIYIVSGFFSKEMAEQMRNSMKEASEMM